MAQSTIDWIELVKAGGPALVGLASSAVAIVALVHSAKTSRRQLRADLVEKSRREWIAELRNCAVDLIVAAHLSRICHKHAFTEEPNLSHEQRSRLNQEHRDLRERMFRAYNALYLLLGSRRFSAEAHNESAAVLSHGSEVFSAKNPPPKEDHFATLFGEFIRVIDKLIQNEETEILEVAGVKKKTSAN